MISLASLSTLSALIAPPQRAPALRAHWRGSAASVVACAVADGELLLTEDGGVRKRILRPGPDDSSTPDWGALVHVAYTGTLLNGTVFEEKTADAPFSFQLNTGAVVDGLERGVETMRVGERAQLTCAADWAHGSLGVPGHIPKDSTLCYDIELLDWEEQDEVCACMKPAAFGPTVSPRMRPRSTQVENDDFDMHVYKRSLEGRDAASGRTADYRWSEGGTEVTLWVPLRDGLRAKDVRCTFLTRELQLQIGDGEAAAGGSGAEGDAAAPGIHFGGKLKGPVVTDDCYWVIDEEDDGARVVQVVLAKKGSFTRWAGVLVGEKEIG